MDCPGSLGELQGVLVVVVMSAPFIVAVPKKKPLAPGTIGRNALDMLATVTEYALYRLHT